MTSIPPALRKRVGAHQHAAAGGGRHCALRPIHPAERIEHLKEENECRDVGALGEAFAPQLHHERCEHQALALGMSDQPAEGFGRMHDVGVGQQQIIRRLLHVHRSIDALLQRPQLPGPSRGQATAAHHAQADRRPARRRVGDIGGAIRTVIVHQDDRPSAGIILPEQRADAVTDAVGLVARRHDRRHARPYGQPCRRRIVAFATAPKGPAGQKQIEPDHQGNRGNHYHARSKPPLHASNPARPRPSRPVPQKQLNIFNELG